MEKDLNEGEYSQFKYYKQGDRLSRLELASENLLKEIGVDIQKFLLSEHDEPNSTSQEPYRGNVLGNSGSIVL